MTKTPSKYQLRIEELERQAKYPVSNYLREHTDWWRLDETVLLDKLSDTIEPLAEWKSLQRPAHLTKQWTRLLARYEHTTDWWLNRMALAYQAFDWSALPGGHESENDRAIIEAIFRMHTHFGATTKCSLRILSTLLPSVNLGLLGRRLKVLADLVGYTPGRSNRDPRGPRPGMFRLTVDTDVDLELPDEFDWSDIIVPLSDDEVSAFTTTMNAQRAAKEAAVLELPPEQRKQEHFKRNTVVSTAPPEDVVTEPDETNSMSTEALFFQKVPYHTRWEKTWATNTLKRKLKERGMEECYEKETIWRSTSKFPETVKQVTYSGEQADAIAAIVVEMMNEHGERKLTLNELRSL